MDIDTIRTYDKDADAYAAQWEEEQAAPDDVRAAVRAYFKAGPTVDVGCGSGHFSVITTKEYLGVDFNAQYIKSARMSSSQDN